MNEKKIVKDSIKNHNYDDLKSAFDSMLSSSGVGDDDFEEVSTEELNEYIDGLECQAEDLRHKLAKANESRKELLEFAQTAHEENVKLVQQLAKANERVAEMEVQHQLLVQKIEPLLDMQEDDGEYYARTNLANDIYDNFIEGSSGEALKKFALEQKIGELLELRGSLGCLDNRDASKFALAINKRIEQLLKEQEK